MDISGHIPVSDKDFKLLLGNCFSIEELMLMTMLLCQAAKAERILAGDQQVVQKNLWGVIGKLLVGLPQGHSEYVCRVFGIKLNEVDQQKQPGETENETRNSG